MKNALWLVESEPLSLQLHANVLSKSGFTVKTFTNPEGLNAALAESAAPNLLIMGTLADGKSLSVLRQLRQQGLGQHIEVAPLAAQAVHAQHHMLGLRVTPLPIRHAPHPAIGKGQAGASQDMQIGGQSGGLGHKRAPRWVQAFILTKPAESQLSQRKKFGENSA